MYIRVRIKFLVALLVSSAWTSAGLFFAIPWIKELSEVIPGPVAIYLITFIAIIPGFMNSFLMVSIAFDKRPKKEKFLTYPSISVMIAAYNEEAGLGTTLDSILLQGYPGKLEIIVINDGSSDRTAEIASEYANKHSFIRLLDLKKNGGKANALNAGLRKTRHNLVVTVDADCYLYRKALVNIVDRLRSDPSNTVAVAGSVLVKNSRTTIASKAQEWDYFLAISASKRVQSLFQGTLVAQGAFSIYRKRAIIEAGGWEETVGEDIVLTWGMLKRMHRIGHAEDAICFTNTPETFGFFFKQRVRWARGMIEAFKKHPEILRQHQFITLFIYWNLLFPLIDIAYVFGFFPGIVLAFFGYYWLAGPMTLLVLPITVLMNFLFYKAGFKTFKDLGLRVRKNYLGLFVYIVFYSSLMQLASIKGYSEEILQRSKKLGNKMKAFFCILLFLLIPLSASGQYILNPEFFYSSDSDDFSQTKYATTVMYGSSSLEQGVEVSETRFSAPSWDESGSAMGYVIRGGEVGSECQLKAGITTYSSGHDNITGSGNLEMPIDKKTSAEFFFERNIVDSRASIDIGNMYTYAGGAVTREFTDRFSMVGLGGVQNYDDGNNRFHIRTKISYTLFPDYGIYSQAQLRYYHDTDKNVNGLYHNPSDFGSGLLGLGLRKFFPASGWRTALFSGGGSANTDGELESIFLVQFFVEKKIKTSRYFRIDAVRDENGGAGNYSYNSILCSFRVEF